MKLIVGLGNVGKEYENTRHNVGFLVLEELIKRTQNSKLKTQNFNLKLKTSDKFNAEIVRIGDIILAKPTTFMNKSGVAVSKIANFYKIIPSDIYAIHDDLDIKLGEYKIQKGVGPKLHYGIRSIDKTLGTNDYWRVRIGVDNRKKMENGTWKMENFTKGEEYVLQKFTEEERKIVDGVVDKVVEEILNLTDT